MEKFSRIEHDALQRDIDHKNSLIQKHEFDMQNQVETVAYLNNEVRLIFSLSEYISFYWINWSIKERRNSRLE